MGDAVVWLAAEEALPQAGDQQRVAQDRGRDKSDSVRAQRPSEDHIRGFCDVHRVNDHFWSSAETKICTSPLFVVHLHRRLKKRRRKNF